MTTLDTILLGGLVCAGGFGVFKHLTTPDVNKALGVFSKLDKKLSKAAVYHARKAGTALVVAKAQEKNAVAASKAQAAIQGIIG